MDSNVSNREYQNRVTLREESLAETKALGLEDAEDQMNAIFVLLHEHGINSRLWLREYLSACEDNGWKTPSDFEKFLPWNLSSEAKKRLSRESHFSYGNARFIQSPDGTVYHVNSKGTRAPIIIGNLTAEEFAELTGTK